ncbi:hypothetical protein JCM18750_32570 [Halostagnicola bangensis]
MGLFVENVASLVAGQPRIVDNIGEPEIGEFLANVRTVRTAFGLVQLEHIPTDGNYLGKP